MPSIHIAITLKQDQASAYLRYLLNQYEVLMAEVWHSDRYRYVPEGQRGPRVLEDHPHIAGLNRSIRALRSELGEKAQ